MDDKETVTLEVPAAWARHLGYLAAAVDGPKTLHDQVMYLLDQARQSFYDPWDGRQPRLPLIFRRDVVRTLRPVPAGLLTTSDVVPEGEIGQVLGVGPIAARVQFRRYGDVDVRFNALERAQLVHRLPERVRAAVPRFQSGAAKWIGALALVVATVIVTWAVQHLMGK